MGLDQRLDYGFTPGGAAEHGASQGLAIVLLEAVRNLRWKCAGVEENASACPAGTVFVVPAEATLTVQWPQPAERLVVRLGEASPLVLDHIPAGAADAPVRAVRFTSKQCLQMAQMIREELRGAVGRNDAYLGALYSVLVNLVNRNARTAGAGGGQQSGLSAFAARQIEAYLRENFRQALSVNDMAGLLGISAGHFATCFRESFGRTPHQYLMKLKLDEAERCLRETDMPISEIAARLSFSSQSHMTTAFRKHHQLTPGEIRRRRGARSPRPRASEREREMAAEMR